MTESRPKLEVAFFRTGAGTEIGMPVVRKLEEYLWEIRVRLDRRIARVIFTVVDSKAVLVHGFIKKSQKIQGSELALARLRAKSLRAAARPQ